MIVDQQPVKREKMHWSETLKLVGNPYAYKPRMEMLHPDGYVVPKRFSPMVRANLDGRQPIFVDVVYDRQYVERYIYESLIKLFPMMPYNDLQKLVSGAIKLKESEAQSSGRKKN